ncbi:helix-turn-helix domain-containing protein [Bacillus sp. V59.32b]|uniref:helix-turn-helix domain-containing protein n=1 Tax=Bacillus sp. V59.32b TaxID=1758642 RepID=UPI000E3C38FE|nr:helix-turn-helix domain-containing protein [Bacillus sp. V59.32b]RFU60375.1 XRE family transcriptional regulator [Bacillus sp. V59.32b]
MPDKARIIGKTIKYLRKQAQLTQSELADGIGTQAQISRIEKGEVIPLCTTLYEISAKLGIDVNFLYNQAYIPRVDYVKEVKYQIRKAIRDRNYEEVDRIIKAEEQNIAFKTSNNLQYIVWHKGVIEFYIRNNFEVSLNLLDAAFNIGKDEKKTPISLQDIEILNSKAIIYNEAKNYMESIETYHKALHYLKHLPEVIDKKVEIRLYYGIAKSLFKTGSYRESINFCKKGINLCIQEEILYVLGELNYEIAQNYQKLNQKDSAIKHYLNAKHLFQVGERLAFVEIVEEKIQELEE